MSKTCISGLSALSILHEGKDNPAAGRVIPAERGNDMYKPEFKERGLVRAVFVVDIGRCGCVDSTSREDAERHGNIWAVGRWYRDDDRDLQENLEKDFDALTTAYRKIGGNAFCGGVYSYEFKAYRK